MKTLKTICCVIISTIGLVACSTSQNSLNTKKASSDKIASTLHNTSWLLKKIDAQAKDFTPTAEQKEIVLTFSKDSYGTSDGCNAIGGNFTIDNNKIVFEAGMSTMRYCGEEMNHLIYKVPLTKTKSIIVKGKELKLLDENDAVIATYIKKDAE